MIIGLIRRRKKENIKVFFLLRTTKRGRVETGVSPKKHLKNNKKKGKMGRRRKKLEPKTNPDLSGRTLKQMCSPKPRE